MVVGNSNSAAEVVYLSLDLGRALWVYGSWSPNQKEPSIHRIKTSGGSYFHTLKKLDRLIRRLRENHGKDVKLHLCYEASFIGYWLARWFRARGVEVYVIAPNSIERPRKSRIAKTDRLDARDLVRKLKQYLESDRRAFSVVYQPSIAEVEIRIRQRERETLLIDIHRVSGRLKATVEDQGLSVAKQRCAAGWRSVIDMLPQQNCYDGTPVSPTVISRMARQVEQLALLESQYEQVEKEIADYHRSLPEDSSAVKLQKFKGIGICSAQQLCAELMNWFRFTNRKQIGKYIGLTSTPNESCGRGHGLGIGKDGNSQLRRVAIQLAWLWRKYQPDCALVRKYQERLDQKGRVRRIAIVALARELMTAFWRYIVHGVEMEGVVTKK